MKLRFITTSKGLVLPECPGVLHCLFGRSDRQNLCIICVAINADLRVVFLLLVTTELSGDNVDAMTDTGVRRQADITSYPIESNHVQIKNNTFKLSGIISETPVKQENDWLDSTGVNGSRVSQAIEYLDKMFDSWHSITLVTGHKVYENIILSGISFD